MKINQVLVESAGATVAFAFGRFNPAHQGHIEVWRTVEQAGVNWFIGTNSSTLGPNDPLTFQQKSAWMTEIYPPISGHIIAEQSVLTLAAYIFKKTRKNESATVAYITDAADWAWSGKLLNQYNGVEGAHGYYKFAQITHVPSPRVSSATALRDAARADDKVAFYHASGTDPKSKVAGLTYFDTVKQAVEKYPLPVKKVKKVKEGWADSIASMLNGKSDLEKINDRRKKLGYEPLLSTPKKITITPAYKEGFKAGTIGFERKENPYYGYQEVTYDLLGVVKQKEADWDRGWLASKQGVVEDSSQKTFTVVYYSKKTDRNVTKTIKANNQSQVWDQLKSKGIDVVSVKEQGLNELAPSSGFGGDDDDKYTPADYGKPFKANYLGQNKFEVFCRKPQDPSNVIKLNAEVQKYGLEWEENFGFWFLDSPGAVYLSWKYGEIPLPKAIDQARNPGHIHDLVTDYLTNSPHAAEIQKIAIEYFGFTADGEMSEGVAEDNLKEFAPGNGGGESGRWYTDDQMTDLVGDGWWNDLDISGDVSKQEMIQEAQAWLDDQGYSVHVLNCKVNDDDMEWFIEGSFQNSNFAKKGMAEGSVTPDVTVNKVHDDGHEKEWHIYRGKEMIGYVTKNQPDTAEGLYIAYGHGPGRAFVEEFTGLKPAVNYIASLKEGVVEDSLGLKKLHDALWTVISEQTIDEETINEIDPGMIANLYSVFPTISKIIVSNALDKARKEAKETSLMIDAMKKHANNQPVTPEENEAMKTQFKDIVSYGLSAVAGVLTGAVAGPAAGAGVALAGAYKKELLTLLQTKGPEVLIGLLKSKGKLDVVAILGAKLLGKHALPFYATPKMAESEQKTVAKTWDQMTPQEKSSGVKGRTVWNEKTQRYYTVFDVPANEVDEASLATMRDYFAGDENARDPMDITKQRLHFAKDKNARPTVDKRFRSPAEYQLWLKQNKLRQISGANESTNDKGWILTNKKTQ